jgi:hypothetical protein
MAKTKTAVPAKVGTAPTKPTAAVSWRRAREEGELITLPSGNVARLRPVALDVLITSGGIPDLLTPIAAKTLWSETDPADIAQASELAEGFAKLVNAIMPAAFIEPRVVENPTADDEIGLDDIQFDDKVAVFNLVTAGAYTLRKFRERQETGLDIVRNGQSNGSAAE